MKPLILLDLDRTLFKTDDFWRDFVKSFTKVNNLKSNSLDEYNPINIDGKMTYYFNYEDLSKKYCSNHEKIISDLKETAKDSNYLYSDASKLLSYINNYKDVEFGVLTLGQDRYQKMKILFCDFPDNVKIFVTLLPKNEFVQTYLSSRTGLLVDDKLGQNLPIGWVEVNIDRKQKISAPRKLDSSIYQISSLSQLPALISQLYLD